MEQSHLIIHCSSDEIVVWTIYFIITMMFQFKITILWVTLESNALLTRPQLNTAVVLKWSVATVAQQTGWVGGRLVKQLVMWLFYFVLIIVTRAWSMIFFPMIFTWKIIKCIFNTFHTKGHWDKVGFILQYWWSFTCFFSTFIKINCNYWNI